MSKKCELTGTTVMYGNNVSHANNKTRRRFLPNLQKKRIWDEENKKFVTMKITARALKTVTKKGLQTMLREAARKQA
ncbi:MAG: 50S ribosomal protein L28 [Candidatus Kapabacteria bacterium]|nr:50S ribosomal protein L28 [Candidatus Kapabacteria bacterium]